MSETRPASRRRGWFKRGVIVVAATGVIVPGLLVGGVRLLDRFAPEYRDALVDRIGQRIDADITVDGLSLGWSWHGPILYLDDFRITRHGAEAPALAADQLGLAFSLTALLAGQRLPDGFVLDHPRATIVERDGQWRLAHWPSGAGGSLSLARLQTLRRQLAGIELRDGQLTLMADRLPGGRATWHDIDFRLTDDNDRRLDTHLAANGPRWLAHVEADGHLRGALDTRARARFSAHVEGLRTATLAGRTVADDKTLTGGTTDARLTGHWQNQRLVDTRVRIDTATVTRRRDDKTLLPAFQAVFDIASDRGARHVTATLSDLSGGPKTARPLALSAMLATREPALDARMDHLPLAFAWRLARAARPRLADTRVTGNLPHAELHWRPRTPLRLGADFSALQVDDTALTLGPVSGHYAQAGGQHTLTFTGADGTLAARHYLKGTLAVSDLGGRLAWHSDADGQRTISLDDLSLASREARVTARGHVRLPADGSAPVVDVVADMSAPDIARLLAHIPEAPDLPNPRLRDWLPKAITAGVLDHGHVEIRGVMDRFPFPHAEPGEGLHVTLAGHGLDIAYKDDWPVLHDARGQLDINGETLDLAIPSSRMQGVAIDNADIHVDDVREPIMQLKGHIKNAESARLLAFLRDSPLHDKLGALVDAISVSGPADLDVDVDLPLKPGLGDPTVAGTVTARGATLRQEVLPGPITAIRGPLDFTGDGLSATNVHGRLLGVPLSADITALADKRERIVARATPRLPDDRKALAHYLPSEWLAYGHGPVPLTVAFALGGGQPVSPIQVTSDLAGTAVNLPAPAAKPASEAAPLHVTINPETHHVTADYDHRIGMAVDLADDGQPKRIGVTLGDRRVPAPTRDGLWISGHAATLDALGWFNVVRDTLYGDTAPAGNHKPTAASEASSLAFLGGDVTIDRTNIGDRYIADAHVRAESMQAEPGWRVNFDGPDSQGQITWASPTHGATRIAGNLKRVALQTEAREPSAPGQGNDKPTPTLLWPDLSPGDLPALDLYVQNFAVDKTDFGQTHINAHVDAGRWSLDRFSLSGGALAGHMTADWQREHDITRASAHADLAGRGLSHLLRTFGYVSPVRADKARIKADLNIAPNVAGLDLLHLGGQVHLALDDGTLLTVEPGPGRLLGLFNLYVLPRRLELNFRDVVDKGLAFDKIRADFQLENGQAYSRNALIKTPSSDVRIAGRIGLATRDYDERVQIRPKLGSGVAIASAVLGGPIIGAAVFAVQELLQKPISHFSAVSYRLKGSWDDPQITDPSALGLSTKDDAEDK